MCEKPYSREDLDNYIKELLSIAEISYQIKRQIRDFVERGLSYKDIARALFFAKEIKHMKLEETHEIYGIGIVRTLHSEARRYFEKLRVEQEEKERRQQEILASTNKQQQIIICTRTDATKKKKRKFIDITQL